jgi:hypothetical protein
MTADDEHTQGCDDWTNAAPGQRGCVCHVWNKGRPHTANGAPEREPERAYCPACGRDMRHGVPPGSGE